MSEEESSDETQSSSNSLPKNISIIQNYKFMNKLHII